MSVLCVHCCTGDFRRFAPWFDLDWISNWDLIPDSMCTFVMDHLGNMH